jgi:hypothetical protein
MNQKAEAFLANYAYPIYENGMYLRELLLHKLPGITEQVDIPAKMIAYCYGQKYIELICTIIPSRKGLKLGFNRGTELPDPDRLLEGNGKISRYVVISDKEMIDSKPLKDLLSKALNAYKERIANK